MTSLTVSVGLLLSTEILSDIDFSFSYSFFRYVHTSFCRRKHRYDAFLFLYLPFRATYVRTFIYYYQQISINRSKSNRTSTEMMKNLYIRFLE